MGSHGVIYHPAKVTFPLVLDLATPEECTTELTYRVGQKSGATDS